MGDFYFYTDGFTVGYNGVPLIKNIKIQLNRGEIMTLIGPNGAGKTTILRSIIKQLEPIGGLAFLDSKKIKDMTGNELARKLAVVLTERVRPEMMTCEDVVATGRYPYTGKFGILSKDDYKVVEESMELVHISELADRDFLHTSDGQKQRVMLARAICQQPDIIVLDEPTSFLDIRYKVEFLSIVQDMARNHNLSVIMSLHELDLAQRVSDKIVCIKGDKVDRFGPPDEIFTKGYVSQLYDMTQGSFDEQTGNVELNAVSGEPEIFIIAGSGSGALTFRRLQRDGVPFAAGIIYENDIDYSVAKGLACELVSLPPFVPADPAASEQTAAKVAEAKAIIDRCGKVICTIDLDGVGAPAAMLRELKAYAEEQGKLGELPAYPE